MKETAEDINKATFKAQLHQILFILDCFEYLTAQRTGFTAHLQQPQDVAFKNMISSVHWTNTAVPFDLLCEMGVTRKLRLRISVFLWLSGRALR